jgi:hypothetical protein
VAAIVGDAALADEAAAVVSATAIPTIHATPEPRFNCIADVPLGC